MQPSAAQRARLEIETDLDAFLVEVHNDPLAYVLGMFPWGEEGTALEHETGPLPWQRQFLIDLGAHMRAHPFNGFDPVPTVKMAVSSGVGPGKTALLSWCFHMLLDTRPDCKCRVTANTATQLETVTWAEIQKWGALKLTADRWTTTSEMMYATGDRTNWFGIRTTCAPENAQAFAGWHNKRSTTANFYDEGGTIPEAIFEKGRGIEVDGESFQFVFGQCSRRSGQLHRAVFGVERDVWDHRIINGYDVVSSPVVLAKYAEWENTYGGHDSDYCRVHIRGLPPNADELQYIDHGRVVQAQENQALVVGNEPLIAGVDVSGGGRAWTVCRFRRGFDARSIPPIRMTGEQTMANERQNLIAKLASVMADQRPTHKVAAMFIDTAFGSAVASRLRQMGYTNVFEVSFGGESLEPLIDANLRAYMWRQAKEWLPKGAIDPKDQRLADDLEAPGFHLNNRNQLVLESKKSMQDRGVASPDDGDALNLTWAMKINPVVAPIAQKPYKPRAAWQ